MKTTASQILFGFILLSFCLSACQPASLVSTPASPALESPQPQSIVASPSPQPSPTAASPRALTICLGQEPNSLYPYANLNSAARSVLSSIYDGPIDTFANGYQPVILEKIPSIANGDAQIAPVSVKRGDAVVDVNGIPIQLDLGVTVLPSGCNDEACAVKYDGNPNLQLDQMVVTFRMLPKLVWSDGTPLTVEDSIYAFKLAADPATSASKYLTDRTQSYESVDELTVQWWGKPGFVDPTYADNFWAPLPKHLWSIFSTTELAKANHVKRIPLGWGAYVFSEWLPGNYIRLEKNPNYFRAAQGLPNFDALIFRFVKDAESGISALVAGQCDLLDTSLRLDGQINLLTALEVSEQVHLVVSTTPLIERLDFGIRPASYDNGYNPAPAGEDRPNLFGDVRTRQAIAFCLDRQQVVKTVLGGLTVVPDSFVPATHPLFNAVAAKYPLDRNRGIELLELVGWLDKDKRPATPRTALNVAGIPDETPLVVNYWTTSALQRRQVSEILSESLGQCGIQVNVKYYDQNDFYAQGPNGPLFGRQFHLAEYAIGVSGTQPPCSWFLSSEIPDRQNGWLGVNVSGYANADYDTVCKRAMRVLPDKPEQKADYDQAQVIFANDIPSIPLYQRIKVVATRKELCNFILDAFSSNDLWNLEEIDYGAACGG